MVADAEESPEPVTLSTGDDRPLSRPSSVVSVIEHPQAVHSTSTTTTGPMPALLPALLVLVVLLLLSNVFLIFKVLSLEARLPGSQGKVDVDSQAVQDAVDSLAALKEALARL